MGLAGNPSSPRVELYTERNSEADLFTFADISERGL